METTINSTEGSVFPFSCPWRTCCVAKHLQSRTIKKRKLFTEQKDRLIRLSIANISAASTPTPRIQHNVIYSSPAEMGAFQERSEVCEGVLEALPMHLRRSCAQLHLRAPKPFSLSSPVKSFDQESFGTQDYLAHPPEHQCQVPNQERPRNNKSTPGHVPNPEPDSHNYPAGAHEFNFTAKETRAETQAAFPGGSEKRSWNRPRLAGLTTNGF